MFKELHSSEKKSFYLYDIVELRALELCGKFIEAGLSAFIAKSAEKTVRESDIVIPMTTSEIPYIQQEWLKPKSFYCAVSLLDADVDVFLKSAQIVVDDLSQCLAEGRPLDRLHKANKLPSNKISELSSWIERPRQPEYPIVFNPMGTVITDLAVGSLVFGTAVEQGVGIQLDI